MRRRRLSSLAALVAVAAASGVCVDTAARAVPADSARGARMAEADAANRPLYTAILDPDSFQGQDGGIAYEHLHRAGARFVRLMLNWPGIAPDGPSKPNGFDPRKPADKQYRWADIDRQVRLAVTKGFLPILDFQGAPEWAQDGQRKRASDGPARPSPTALADFATALAKRYSGSFANLPRVRYFQVWNEPNLSIQLMPQFNGDTPVSPDWYRSMVNAMAQAVQAVHADNVVIAGALAPFGGNLNDPGANVSDQERVHPMDFMRRLLCMSAGPKPKPTCNEKTEFDVWAHHPYTYGGPTHHAVNADDVSIGDLGKMHALLLAAAKAGHIKSHSAPRFWVTEFSWDSRPPDNNGLPVALHARWVSEALYRMWMDGVSLVTWFLLRDEPFPQSMFQSGLYFRGGNGIASDRPKPTLRAFRFPFVAFRQKSGAISYWGRTPAGVKKAVVVEQKSDGRWRRVAVPPVDRYGIFLGRVKAHGRGSLRAVLVDRSDFSLPFSLSVPKDFRFCPWGSFC